MGLASWTAAVKAQAEPKHVILSTTTSTQDSGLLDVLVPSYVKQTGYNLKAIAVGTGQALELAARGDADVVLAHAPSLEKKYAAEGKLINRRLVMYNDFVIIGPKEDPAKIRTAKSVGTAFEAIKQANAWFVSRGDNSGTHNLELIIWQVAGVKPKGSWYIETGQGMGATLAIANERNGYTLTDRGTYLALRKRLKLPILFAGDKLLLNIYSIMEANPANGPRINAPGGKAFAHFMVSAQVQAIIKSFGVKEFGEPLFRPAAGSPESDLGG